MYNHVLDVGILAIYNVGGSFITLSIHFLPNIVFCAGQQGVTERMRESRKNRRNGQKKIEKNIKQKERVLQKKKRYRQMSDKTKDKMKLMKKM